MVVYPLQMGWYRFKSARSSALDILSSSTGARFDQSCSDSQKRICPRIPDLNSNNDTLYAVTQLMCTVSPLSLQQPYPYLTLDQQWPLSESYGFSPHYQQRAAYNKQYLDMLSCRLQTKSNLLNTLLQALILLCYSVKPSHRSTKLHGSSELVCHE